MSSGQAERRALVITLSLGLLLLIGLAAYAWSELTTREAANDLFHSTREVIEQLNQTYVYVQDAETGQRGFLITQNPKYLASYEVAVQQITPTLDALAQRYAGDTRQLDIVNELRERIAKKMEELRETINVAHIDLSRAHTMVRDNRGIDLMHDIHSRIETLRKNQYERLRETDTREQQAADQVFTLILAGNLLTLTLVGFSLFLTLRDSRVKEQAEAIREQAILIDQAPVLSRTLNGRILSWSLGDQQLYGWSEAEAIGQNSHTLLRTRSVEPMEKIHAVLLSEGQWIGELTQTRRDGQELVVTAAWTLFKEVRRRPQAVVEVHTDITALKAAQTAQAESDARFRLIADNISQLAWTTDDTGTPLWYNQRWFDYTNASLDDMRGGGWKSVCHPDYIERVVASITKSLKAGTEWEDTFPLRSKDGHYRWFLSRAIPIHDTNGRVLRWFGTNTDVTELRLAEHRLQDHATFTHTILNSLHEHIAVITREGVIIQVNEAWTRFAQTNPGNASTASLGVGANYLDVLRTTAENDEDTRKALDGILATLLGQQPLFEMEYPCHAPNEQRWFHMSVTPLETPDGGAVIAHADITSQRLAKNVQAQLAAIVDGSTDAMISKTRDGHILTWNRGAEELFGYSSEEMIGRSIDTLVPDELRKEAETLRAKVQSNTPTTPIESQRLHRTGRHIDVSISLSPIRDDAGTIIGTSQIFRDITDRRRAELALARSDARFRTLISAIPQLVWSCTPNGSCDYVSDQWLAYAGGHLDDYLNYKWLTIIHPEDVPPTNHAWQQAVATGASYTVEYRLRGADGSYQWFLGRAEAVRDSAGTITNWFGTCTNIQALKETAAAFEHTNHLLKLRSEELTAANKELEAFSYSVSHDLRAPLRTMTGFSQALLEDYSEKLEPEAVRHLNIISKGAQQLGHLIDDLLSFARLSRQPLLKNRVDLNELVDEIRVDMATETAGRAVHWEVGTLPICQGDRTTLKLVLANLIGNAVKYSRPRDPSRIEITWDFDDRQPGFARISVKDNGVGFDMRYADKLFGVFQRLHKAGEFEGTGVGLAIVQRIIHRHHGRVWADSRLGEGATFEFTLELAS